MAKRQLSKNQRRRVQSKQSRSRDAANRTDKALSDAYTRYLAEPENGIIITNFGRQALVRSRDNLNFSQACHLRANLDTLVTGDKVVWRRGEQHGVVESLHPRDTELQRPDSFGNVKPVAANVSRMFITLAIAPEPHLSLIDRYLVAAENNGLEAVILVNKSDLIDKNTRVFFDQLEAIYQPLGYPVIYASAHQQHGFDSLRARLKNHMSIFVGQSGVGKSSLIQGLLPNEELKIGDLSELVAKGRHTTTHSSLYAFGDDGYCIDSPGIREFGLWHYESDEILRGFVDLNNYAGHCRFRDCSHQQQPGCALEQAFNDGKIAAERYYSFLRILNHLDEVEIKTKR